MERDNIKESMEIFMKELNNKSGFTLVELMVVVGIIGILSAVAIPRFQTYQAKSKTSEAKINLSAIYSAEVSLMSDYDNYGTCLAFAGYGGPGANSYYAVGFSAAGAAANLRVRNNGGGTAATGCGDANSGNGQFSWPGGKSVGGQQAVITWITAATVAATGATFTAKAVGAIATTATSTGAFQRSEWQIDQDKLLQENLRGY